MVGLRSFVVVSFFSISLSESIYMNGSEERLSANESFNVNEEEPYSTSSLPKPLSNILPKPMYTISSSKLNIQPNIKLRLSLCCDLGVAREHGSCFPNNTITDTVLRIFTRIIGHVDTKEVSTKNFDPVIGDPCDFDWMVPFVLNNFSVLENGSISDEDSSAETLYDLEHYCLFRNPEAVDYSARVCYPLIMFSSWKSFCTVIIMLVMLAISIVYSVIPEYKNLHGMMFRAYIGTYGILAGGVLGWKLTYELRTKPYLYRISDIIVRYCGGACALWFSAMSFDIWRSFRGLRPIDFHNREYEKRKFICYAVYAWGTPAIGLTALLFTLDYLPYFRHEILGYNLKLWSCLIVLSIVYITNTSLFISTALAIKHHRKDTADLINNVTRHHSTDESWFRLHIKLFVLMGGHIVMWIIWFNWPSLATSDLFGATELIQAIFMFVTSIWKKDVKQSFCKQLTKLRMKRSTVDTSAPISTRPT